MGFNYQIDDNNSFGGFYQNTYDYMKTRRENNDDLLATTSSTAAATASRSTATD